MDKAEAAKVALRQQGLSVYEVGFVVKNLSTCNFCKREEVEGIEAAKALDASIAGQAVPFPPRAGYSGCANACGESLTKDIGIIKMKDGFNIYVGGETKTMNASIGDLLAENISETDLSTLVNRIIEVYRTNGKKRERFSNFVRRYTIESLRLDVLLPR